MRIAIPVNEDSQKTDICPSFGRAPFFMIKNTEINEYKFLINDAAESAGGAGIKAAQLFLNEKIDVVITPRCGENSAKVMQDADVKIFKSQGSIAIQNFDLYEKGQLSPLTDIHAGFHGHGG